MENSNNSNESKAEMANICLIANDQQQSNEVNYAPSETDSSEFDDSESDDEDLPYDLLLEQSYMIALEYKKCKAKLKAALLENQKLKQSNENKVQELQTIQNRLIANPTQTIILSEVEKLIIENNNLKKDLAKFVERSSKLNLLLQNKRLPFSKEGIGYEEDENKNSYNLPLSIYR